MGFGVGIYVGTKYDCAPTINFINNCLKKYTRRFYVV